MAGDGDDRSGPPARDPPPRGRTSHRATYDDGARRDFSSNKDDREYGSRFREDTHRSFREDGRGRDKFKDGGEFRDRRHRDDKDRERNYGGHGGRNRRYSDRGGRSESDRRHEHEHEHDRDWTGRRRSRSRGLSQERKHESQRSDSRSDSRDRKSKRTSGFDLAPPGATVMTAASLPGQLLGLTQTMHGMYPSMIPFAGGTQATRHARRVYVGGLPPTANEQSVATYFSQVMAAIGGNTAGPGDAVVNVYINQEKRFAFVEMRTVEEASNAMALDGIVYEGVSVRVRRPSDYNPSMAATLGPGQPSAHLNLGAVGLIPGATVAADGPDRIFVGGLPYYLTEEQIINLLSSFGSLRAFELVKDRETGSSKGYGFCVYQDPNIMDVACAALNGLKMGDRTLTVRRASASGQPKPDQVNLLEQAQQQVALQMVQKLALQVIGSGASFGAMGSNVMMPGLGGINLSEVPTRVLCLSQVVSPDELLDDSEYEEIVQDMREECGKFGTVAKLIIPRPATSGEGSAGVGAVFVEYADIEGSLKAKASLNGRKFGGNMVIAVYYSEEKFLNGDFGG